MRRRSFFFGSLFALAAVLGSLPSMVLAAPRDACTIVTRTDVAAAVGRGTATMRRHQRYPGETSSACYYDSEDGYVGVFYYPDNGDNIFSSVQASYRSLETVPGLGVTALYSKPEGTLAMRSGRKALLLTLVMPDSARARAILIALARRVSGHL